MTTTWPTGTLSTSFLDESGDNPANARIELLAAVNKLNAILTCVDAGATVYSTANVGAFDAQTLDGESPSYYLNAENIIGTVDISNGGTNRLSLTQYQLLAGQGSSPIVSLSNETAGYALISNGANAYPTFQPLTSAIISTEYTLSVGCPILDVGLTTQKLQVFIPLAGKIKKACISIYPIGSTTLDFVMRTGAASTVTSSASFWTLSGIDTGLCSTTLDISVQEGWSIYTGFSSPYSGDDGYVSVTFYIKI